MADEEELPEEEDPPIEEDPPNYDSILISIKKLLGIEADYTQFDPDILIYINSAFMTLFQLGVGSTTAFSIASDEAEWGDFLGTRTDIEAVKTYVYLKVRLVFDPPQTGYLVDAVKAQITEIEWRLNS